MPWWDALFNGEQRAKVPVARLTFDATNPRYTPDKSPANSSETAIIEYLDRTADLGELIQSISASGYIDIEPLIVIGRDDNLVVLEGNRRLAALKVLNSPGLAAEANVSVPEISDAERSKLQHVTVFKVNSEDDARDLIGFKHINGPQAWDAYAKALYAARWLDEQQGRGNGALTLTDIAARMGDKHDTLYRIVSAVYVLQQAEASDLFRIEDRVKRNFSFSHLYTALTYNEYREFIGLPRADRSANPPRDPVSPEYLGNLKTLLRWIYGSKSEGVQPAIKTQAPDLSLLKRVLGHPLARRVMLERNDLSDALELTVEASDRFEKALIDAHAALRIATGELANVRADKELRAIAADILRRAEFIVQNFVTAAGQGSSGPSPPARDGPPGRD
ncbi:MAG TPA: ParB N-terminal domain-containing protein [Allosphingosinicella sp.]|jgi:hypothetical protein